MDIKLGNPYPSGALSNLAPHKFIFQGIECGSMEGLLQGFKFKNAEMQIHICTLAGKGAKRSGKDKKWFKSQVLWCQGKPIKRDSDEYQQLLDEAYDCLFRQNEKARNALLATNDAVLKHSIGRRKINETVLTQKEFCSRLMKIRNQLKAEAFLEFNDDT